jgi:G2/mitotic-specific cyclin 1/2
MSAMSTQTSKYAHFTQEASKGGKKTVKTAAAPAVSKTRRGTVAATVTDITNVAPKRVAKKAAEPVDKPAKAEKPVVETKKRATKSIAAPVIESNPPPVFSAPTKKEIQEASTTAVVPVEHVTKKLKAGEWDDLDAEDEFDPLMVSEYVTEIFEYMQELEVLGSDAG